MHIFISLKAHCLWKKKKVILSASACRILLRRVSSADFRCVWVLLLHCSLPQQTTARTCLDCAVHGNVLFEMDVAESCSKTSVVKLTCLLSPLEKTNISWSTFSETTSPKAVGIIYYLICKQWFLVQRDTKHVLACGCHWEGSPHNECSCLCTISSTQEDAFCTTPLHFFIIPWSMGTNTDVVLAGK